MNTSPSSIPVIRALARSFRSAVIDVPRAESGMYLLSQVHGHGISPWSWGIFGDQIHCSWAMFAHFGEYPYVDDNWKDHFYVDLCSWIWANYHISLTWIKAIFGHLGRIPLTISIIYGVSVEVRSFELTQKYLCESELGQWNSWLFPTVSGRMKNKHVPKLMVQPSSSMIDEGNINPLKKMFGILARSTP